MQEKELLYFIITSPYCLRQRQQIIEDYVTILQISVAEALEYLVQTAVVSVLDAFVINEGAYRVVGIQQGIGYAGDTGLAAYPVYVYFMEASTNGACSRQGIFSHMHIAYAMLLCKALILFWEQSK